jgi:hypothetical protein
MTLNEANEIWDAILYIMEESEVTQKVRDAREMIRKALLNRPDTVEINKLFAAARIMQITPKTVSFLYYILTFRLYIFSYLIFVPRYEIVYI